MVPVEKGFPFDKSYPTRDEARLANGVQSELQSSSSSDEQYVLREEMARGAQMNSTNKTVE
jgi:hypothetical protein